MGRILAIDYGTKRMGTALSDPSRVFAFPLEMVPRSTPERESQVWRQMTAEHEVEQILMGLPLRADGTETDMSRAVRGYGRMLADLTGLPVIYQDERYTTAEVKSILHASGLKRSQWQSKRDTLAAQVILKSYLEAGCPRNAHLDVEIAAGAGEALEDHPSPRDAETHEWK